jgi:hypothetical protein
VLTQYLRDLVARQFVLASITSEVGTSGDTRSSICAVEESAGRFKLLYKLPPNVAPLRTVVPVKGLELRCAAGNGKTVQDVLPELPEAVLRKMRGDSF